MHTRIINFPAITLCFMGALVTYAVYQLKPSSVSTATTPTHVMQTIINPIDQYFFLNKTPTSTTDNEIDQTNLNTEPYSRSHYYALTLNELLLDFFTTEFNQKTIDKWQDKLYEGSPYLSELAGYLKLDKLYGIDLFLSENQTLTESIELSLTEKSDTEKRPNLFKFIHYYGEQYWPMSLLTNEESTSQTLRLLLNNYDRDFVLKIEKQGLANHLAPLAIGIERLLSYHLSQSISNSSGLRTYRLAKNIDQVVMEFNRRSPGTKDIFKIYNYLIQQKWDDAAILLSQSEQLKKPQYQFLYDILSVNASGSLLKSVTYDQYQENTAWWQKFLTYELCISSDNSYRADIVQRISVTVSCLNDLNGIEVPTLQSGPDTEWMVRVFWDMVLNSANLSNKKLDNFLASQPSQLHNSYFALNSHTILDKFAEMDRLKVIRNAYLFQRVENNYQTWRKYIGAANSDSFYIFTPIHQWLNPTNTSYRSDLNKQLPELLPQLSNNVQKFLAKELLDHIESGLVNKSNLHLYHSLLPIMPIEDHFVLQAFSKHSNWAAIKPLPNYSQLSDSSKKRHSDVALHLVFNTRSTQIARESSTFDGYMFGMETFMREFSMQYSMFNISKEIEHSFDNQGSLTNSAIRRLVRLWKRTWPNSDLTSEAYQLP